MSEKMSGNTYRITIEAIGPEEVVYNQGKPQVIDVDGFFLVFEDQEHVGAAVRAITPMRIAEAIYDQEFAPGIMTAMVLHKMREAASREKEATA